MFTMTMIFKHFRASWEPMTDFYIPNFIVVFFIKEHCFSFR